jgi:ubiquinone/menaquinone biosynthesis C-methylase UbiE
LPHDEVVAEKGYRESHTDPGKGAEYEHLYATDSWNRYVWEREQQILQRAIADHLAGVDIRYLDFACGTGRVISFLEDQVSEATGVDVSPSMLEQARGKVTTARLVEADITRDDVLPKGSFDLITAFRFFVNAEPALREAGIAAMSELLAPGGILVFNNHHNSAAPYVQAVRSTLRFNDGLKEYNVMSRKQMESLASGAGLKIIDVMSAGLLRVPKLHFKEETLARWDDAAARRAWLGRFSEDLVAVCTKG